MLDDKFAAKWFPALVKRIGNDLAASGFWNALSVYCEKHIKSALSILQLLFANQDDSDVAVAAYMLGVLRTVPKDSDELIKFNKLETDFANSSNLKTRSIYYRSWIQTTWRGKMSRADFEALIDRMNSTTSEEKNEAFLVISKSLLSPSIAPECFSYGLEWIKNNASSKLSPEAKYFLVDLAANLAELRSYDAGEPILLVQPIPLDNKGTWKRLEAYLVKRLHTDLEGFNSFFLRLTERSATDLYKVMHDPQTFDWLLSEMRKKDMSSIVGASVFSQNAGCRKLGLFLFDKLDVVSLPETFLKDIKEAQLRLAFYEAQRNMLSGDAIARFLIIFIPCVLQASPTFQDEIYEEVVLQAKNYGGGCRKKFEKRAEEFPILKKALNEVKIYFDGLHQALESCIGSIEVTGYRQAARLSQRRFSNEVQAEVEERSILAKFAKKVCLLYGRGWGSYHNGKVGDTVNLNAISHSIEIPRLEEIDPEGMALRRINASLKIASLSKTCELSEEDDE